MRCDRLELGFVLDAEPHVYHAIALDFDALEAHFFCLDIYIATIIPRASIHLTELSRVFSASQGHLTFSANTGSDYVTAFPNSDCRRFAGSVETSHRNANYCCS